MPYSPSTGIYTLPAVYLAIPGSVIVAVQHNDPLVDLQTAQNYERPIIAGGTGAGTASAARTNLGVPSSTTTPSYTAPTVDNEVVRWDGVAGAQQGSPLVVADSATGSATLTATNDTATGARFIGSHVSASPAANDVALEIVSFANDSGGGTDQIADLQAVLVDPTAASEDALWRFRTVIAGTLGERAYIGAGIYTNGATGGDPGAGKINATELQVNGANQSITEVTPVATTSGTSVTLSTSIPATAKRITLTFNGVSLSGTDAMLIQLGDAGGFETSGYLGSAVQISTGFTQVTAASTGFGILTDNAGQILYGSVTLSVENSSLFFWTASGVLSTNGGVAFPVSGFKNTSAVMDRIRVASSGSNTFDAGAIGLLIEQ